MTKLKVAVLMGGTSAERDVSLSTGRQILASLDESRYSVTPLDAANVPAVLSAFQTDRPDVVFIALHGPGGEDGTVQGFLEVLGLPYTGSGVLASALAMDKAMSKRVLTAAGVTMPDGMVVQKGQPAPPGFPLPAIVKPSAQGSTVGMTVVREALEMDAALALAFEHGGTALIEEFVTGMEITVPVLGNTELEVLPIVEIVPHSGFYDYHDKYTPGATDEIVPARLPASVAEEARRVARLCHATLGCRGMSRTDIIADQNGTLYTLEVNTIPGMTPTSLLPRSAAAAGLSFSQLLDKLMGFALETDTHG